MHHHAHDIPGQKEARVALKRRVFAPLIDGREPERPLSAREVELNMMKRALEDRETSDG